MGQQDDEEPKGLVDTKIGRACRVRVQEQEGWPVTC